MITLRIRDAITICSYAGLDRAGLGVGAGLDAWQGSDGVLHAVDHLAGLEATMTSLFDLADSPCRCLDTLDGSSFQPVIKTLAAILIDTGLAPGPFGADPDPPQEPGSVELSNYLSSLPHGWVLGESGLATLERAVAWIDERCDTVRTTLTKQLNAPTWRLDLLRRCHRMNAFGMSTGSPAPATDALAALGTALGMGTSPWFTLVDDLVTLADREPGPDLDQQLADLLGAHVEGCELEHVDQLHFALTTPVAAGEDLAQVAERHWRSFLARQADAYRLAVLTSLAGEPDTTPMLVGPLPDNHRWWGSEELCRLTEMARRTWEVDEYFVVAPAEVAWFIADPDVFGSDRPLAPVPVDGDRPELIETALTLWRDAATGAESPLADPAQAVAAARVLN